MEKVDNFCMSTDLKLKMIYRYINYVMPKSSIEALDTIRKKMVTMVGVLVREMRGNVPPHKVCKIVC